jgi:hypothetical protein
VTGLLYSKSLFWRSVKTRALRQSPLIPRVARRAREGDGVADSGETGGLGEGAPGERPGPTLPALRGKSPGIFTEEVKE